MTEPVMALYYPGLVWRDPKWLKNILLFFDGISLLVPEFLRSRVEESDPSLVIGLQEHGLLRLLDPEEVIDQETARVLVSNLAGLLQAGVFDDLVEVAGSMAARLSLSRLGHSASPELAETLLEELERRGLAARVHDGLSVSLQWVVRLVIMVLLVQTLRLWGKKIGLDLSPATDRPNVHMALAEFLNLPSLPSAGQVVTVDLDAVGVDLSAVPIEEILEFREEHGEQFRAYTRDIRATVHQLSILSPADRATALNDRREALIDAGHTLARQAKYWWRKPASVTLGVTGAAWTLKTGNPVGASLGALAAIIAGLPSSTDAVDAYSYLLRSHELMR